MRANFRIVIVVCALLAQASCSKGEKGEEPMVQKVGEDSLKLSDDAIKNLKLARVEKGEFPDELSLMGRISVPEDRVAVIPARVSGRIDAVYVASGEVVLAGQAMASLFSPDFVIAREEYLQALAQTHSADSEESRHLLALSRKKLDALGMSKPDVDRLGASQGSGQGSDQTGASKNENLTVRAPRGGALLDKKAVVGTFVNQGDTLFTVGDLSKVWFAGDVYPEDLQKIHKSQEVEIEPGNGAPTVHGKVSFISPVIDPTSRTIKIRALMENPGNQLRADMFVKGNVILNKRTALIAPKAALVRLRDTLFVFRRAPGNVFKRVPVVVGAENASRIAVTSGLDDGAEIVTEGALLLDGALSGNGS